MRRVRLPNGRYGFVSSNQDVVGDKGSISVQWRPIRWGLVWAIFFAPLTFGLSFIPWLVHQLLKS
jgi:hypothetical protein